MAYATVEDLEKRWRRLTPSERETAGVLLYDASLILDQHVKCADFDIMGIVVCNMVRRAMDPDTIAASQLLESGWESQSPANRLMPEWNELKMLKRGAMVGFASMADL